MLLGREKIIYERVIRNYINNGTLSKSQDKIFIRGEGCNTPGVWLAYLHLHFISMSIIHPIHAFVLLATWVCNILPYVCFVIASL
jgi:hypothetical protein